MLRHQVALPFHRQPPLSGPRGVSAAWTCRSRFRLDRPCRQVQPHRALRGIPIADIVQVIPAFQPFAPQVAACLRERLRPLRSGVHPGHRGQRTHARTLRPANAIRAASFASSDRARIAAGICRNTSRSGLSETPPAPAASWSIRTGFRPSGCGPDARQARAIARPWHCATGRGTRGYCRPRPGVPRRSPHRPGPGRA